MIQLTALQNGLVMPILVNPDHIVTVIGIDHLDPNLFDSPEGTNCIILMQGASDVGFVTETFHQIKEMLA